MRTLIIITVFITYIGGFGTDIFASYTVPKEAVEMARIGMEDLFNNAPRDFLEKRGFLNPSEKPSEARLGAGYPMYRIETELALSGLRGDNFKSLLTLVAWAFPVYVKDQPRTMICVRQNEDGTWDVNEIGGNPRPVLNARRKWKPERGYSHSTAFMINGPKFVMLEKDNDIKLISLFERNERVLGIQKKADGMYPLLDPSYVLKKLKPILKKKIRIQEQE
jgi:hypothetical protein